MAIRFVDVQPGEAAEPPGGRRRPAPDARPERASAPTPAHESASGPTEGVPFRDGAAPPDGGAFAPDLPHPKPEPKPRGRKKPMSAVGAGKSAGGQAGHRPGDETGGQPGGQAARARAPDAASVPLLEGLLPELQAHAKPAPKPRGRKKAFG